MTQPGEDKLSKVEELKKRLFSRNYQMKVEHRDNFSPLPSQQVPEAWQGESEKPKLGEQIFMKTSFFKKFFLFSCSSSSVRKNKTSGKTICFYFDLSFLLISPSISFISR